MMVKTLNQDWTVYFMDNQKEEFPSIKEQGKNLAKFTFEVVKDSVLNIGVTEGEVFASDELKKERMDICKKCEYYSMRQERCKKCGCWLVHKVKFKVSECPIKKW